MDHLHALIEFAVSNNLDKIYLHAFLDGRDTLPQSAQEYIRETEKKFLEVGKGRIATIMGRYYAMDRDHRWERINVAYEALINGTGEESHDILTSIAAHHAKKENDEFIRPIIMANTPRITSKDSVIFFNSCT